MSQIFITKHYINLSKMQRILLVTAFALLATALSIPSHAHDLTFGQFHLMDLAEVHEQGKTDRSLVFKYQPVVDSKTYLGEKKLKPRIMDFLPLTVQGSSVSALNTNISQVRQTYLKGFGPSKTVELSQAEQLAAFFATNTGKKVLTYFEGISQKGLNYYHLSNRNYRLWLAIKIIANKDYDMYGISVAEDAQLFKEFYEKARDILVEEVKGIPSPVAKPVSKPAVQPNPTLKVLPSNNLNLPSHPNVLPPKANTDEPKEILSTQPLNKANLPPQANPQAKPQPNPQPNPQANPQAKPQANPQAKPQPNPQPNPQANPQAKPQANPQAKPQPNPQPNPQANPQAKPQANPQANPQPNPQPNPQANPQAKPQANPQPNPQPNPQANPQAKPQANPQAKAQIKNTASPLVSTKPAPANGGKQQKTPQLPNLSANTKATINNPTLLQQPPKAPKYILPSQNNPVAPVSSKIASPQPVNAQEVKRIAPQNNVKPAIIPNEPSKEHKPVPAQQLIAVKPQKNTQPQTKPQIGQTNNKPAAVTNVVSTPTSPATPILPATPVIPSPQLLPRK